MGYIFENFSREEVAESTWETNLQKLMHGGHGDFVFC